MLLQVQKMKSDPDVAVSLSADDPVVNTEVRDLYIQISKAVNICCIIVITPLDSPGGSLNQLVPRL